jgi:hypothetical protein
MHHTTRFTRIFTAATAALLLTGTGALAQVCGDPTGDGLITDADGVNVLRAAASLSSACASQTCDINADGVINDVDGVNVLRAAAELPATLECIEEEINDFVSNVETEEGQPPAELRVGAAPIPDQGAPGTIGTIEGNTAVMAGGSNTVTVPYDASTQAAAAGVGPAQLSGLLMVIAIATPADEGADFADGYFTIPLSTVIGQVTITMRFPASLGPGTFLLCPATEFQGALSQYGALPQEPTAGANQLGALPPQSRERQGIMLPDGREVLFSLRRDPAGDGTSFTIELDSAGAPSSSVG